MGAKEEINSLANCQQVTCLYILNHNNNGEHYGFIQ
jgi:hypothetical protein